MINMLFLGNFLARKNAKAAPKKANSEDLHFIQNINEKIRGQQTKDNFTSGC